MEYLDRISEAYEGLLGEAMQRKSQQRVDWICDQVQGSTVLDIGCSQGICEVLLGRRGFQVTGIDRAQESVSYARKLIDQEPFDVRLRVRLLCADFIKEAELNDKYDTVLLTEILEHLEDPKEMVKKAAESLDSGGKMIVTVPFGINDFPDHKQTFYMADISKILSEWVRIDQVKDMGEWIGFCCTKVDCANPIEKIDSSLVLQEEKMFFALERPLRDELKSLSSRAKKLKSDYEAMKSNYEAMKSDYEAMKSNYEAMKSDYETMKSRYEAEEKKRRDQEKQAAEARNVISELNGQYESVRQELEQVQTASEKLLEERNFYSEKYSLLANAKLGRLTLKYWKVKDWFLARFRRKHITK